MSIKDNGVYKLRYKLDKLINNDNINPQVRAHLKKARIKVNGLIQHFRIFQP